MQLKHFDLLRQDQLFLLFKRSNLVERLEVDPGGREAERATAEIERRLLE